MTTRRPNAAVRKHAPRNRGRPLAPKKRRASGRKAKSVAPGVVVAVHATSNRKTGRVNATYVSQGSCPVTCPLLGAGCYAETGPLGRVTDRLNSAGAGLTPAQYARAEAVAIDNLRADHDLRPHIVGDCRTPAAARILGLAMDRYVERSAHILVHTPSVWLYTHAWRSVGRGDWGHSASVLASCETASDATRAREKGYAVALVVDKFERNGIYTHESGLFRVVPCPYQTRGVQCVDCRICFDDDKLLEMNLVVGFEAHGSRRASIVRSLEVLSQTEGGAP